MPYIVASRAGRLAQGDVDRAEAAEQRARDAKLVEATLAGEPDAFRELVQHYEDRVTRVALGVVGHPEEARDVAQEAFLRTYRSLGRFQAGQSFYTWLYRIVVNLSIDALRKRASDRHVALEDFGESMGTESPPDAVLAQRDLRRQVQRVLSLLPTKYRVVLVLRDMDELGCWDIAKVVGCTHATARWRLHKARKMFRDAWDRDVRRGAGPVSGGGAGGASAPVGDGGAAFAAGHER